MWFFAMATGVALTAVGSGETAEGRIEMVGIVIMYIVNHSNSL